MMAICFTFSDLAATLEAVQNGSKVSELRI